MSHEHLDKAAQDAVARHRLRKLDSLLELVLEDLVAADGVKAVRVRLLNYCRQLREFHT